MRYTTTYTTSITKTKRSNTSDQPIGVIARELLKSGVNSSTIKGNKRVVLVDRNQPMYPTLWVTESGRVEEVENVNTHEFTLPLSFPWDEFMEDRIAFVKANL